MLRAEEGESVKTKESYANHFTQEAETLKYPRWASRGPAKQLKAINSVKKRAQKWMDEWMEGCLYVLCFCLILWPSPWQGKGLLWPILLGMAQWQELGSAGHVELSLEAGRNDGCHSPGFILLPVLIPLKPRPHSHHQDGSFPFQLMSSKAGPEMVLLGNPKCNQVDHKY